MYRSCRTRIDLNAPYLLLLYLPLSYRLTAVLLLINPMVALGSGIQHKVMQGFQGDGLKVFEESGRVATEAVQAVRTVHANNLAHDYLDRYATALDKPLKASIRNSQLAGVAFGWAELCLFAMWAIAFGFGSYLVDQGDCSFAQFMTALSAISFGAMNFGRVAALLPDAAAGKVAATRIFRLLDRKSLIDPQVWYCAENSAGVHTGGYRDKCLDRAQQKKKLHSLCMREMHVWCTASLRGSAGIVREVLRVSAEGEAFSESSAWGCMQQNTSEEPVL